MNREPLLFAGIIVVVSVMAGYGHGVLYSLQHHVSADWAVLVSYLVVIPLGQVLMFAPGVLAGYLQGARWPLVLVVCIPSYVLFQAAGAGGFNLDVPTALAHGASYTVGTLVAVLAGAYVAQGRHVSNNSLKADGADAPPP